jgi:hypothetical protein
VVGGWGGGGVWGLAVQLLTATCNRIRPDYTPYAPTYCWLSKKVETRVALIRRSLDAATLATDDRNEVTQAAGLLTDVPEGAETQGGHSDRLLYIVCVCVREREREGGREKEIEFGNVRWFLPWLLMYFPQENGRSCHIAPYCLASCECSH